MAPTEEAETPEEPPVTAVPVSYDDEDDDEGQLTIDESRADVEANNGNVAVVEPRSPEEEEEATSPPAMMEVEEDAEAPAPNLESLLMQQSQQTGMSGDQLMQ